MMRSCSTDCFCCCFFFITEPGVRMLFCDPRNMLLCRGLYDIFGGGGRRRGSVLTGGMQVEWRSSWGDVWLLRAGVFGGCDGAVNKNNRDTRSARWLQPRLGIHCRSLGSEV